MSYPKYEKLQKGKQKKEEGYYDRFMNFLKSSRRVLKIANKPNNKEYFLVFKICAIGIVILGALSYIIQLIFSVALPIGK
ncbi:MAG: protein translocase SEC61 complex subunit gamma [Promethearchaeota archaeon]